MNMSLHEIVEMRNVLMRELNAGYFDRDSWLAIALLARDNNCPAIAAQMARYIEHYSGRC